MTWGGTITIPERGLYYGARQDHFLIERGAPLPPHVGADRKFLYLCVYADRLKVGVSSSLYGRVNRHGKIGGDYECIYLILLPRLEAYGRETLVRQAFGLPGNSRSRQSEWLPREALPDALLLMRCPEMSRIYTWLLSQRGEMARGERDRRFRVVGRWDGVIADNSEAAAA